MLRIPVTTSSCKYESILDPGILGRAGEVLRGLLDPVSAFIVTVPVVRRRWGKTLLQSLKAAKFDGRFIEMPDGERFKRLSTIELLADKMLSLGADRRALLIAFGGGVVGDVAGMLASVYMRGVKLVQVPTTVQAQLDAAIGGKTGVNLRGGKNLVGTFCQPEAVLIDPEVLSTLPDREFRAGMYEALKCGVIGNAELFSCLENSSIEQFRNDERLLTRAIAESVRLKSGVVSADEREGDLRRILNFGHTIGHALEAATNYKHFLHGEAVAWGMIAATRISVEIGCCGHDTYVRIRSAILKWGNLPAVKVPKTTALKMMQSDKKAESGVLHFVLPKQIGVVEIVKGVPEQAVALGLDEIRRASRA
jgi:3-dehydroquinate synthase